MKTFTIIAQNSKLTIQNYSFTLNSIFCLKFFSPLFRVFRVLFIVADGCFAIFFLATINLIHCCRQAYPQATHYCRQQTSYPLLQTANKLPIVAENCCRSSGFLGLLQLSQLTSSSSSLFFVFVFVAIVKSLHCLRPTSFQVSFLLNHAIVNSWVGLDI